MQIFKNTAIIGLLVVMAIGSVPAQAAGDAPTMPGNIVFEEQNRDVSIPLDQTLDFSMPKKYSMFMAARTTYLESDSDYREKISLNGNMPDNEAIFRIGIRYRFQP